MDKLQASQVWDGLLPMEIGAVRVAAYDLGVLTSLSPYGDVAPVTEILQSAHAMALPQAGSATGKEGARCIWFGIREVLLAGPHPDPRLAEHAAVVDVSDGWVGVTIDGSVGVDVLARLVPVDLRAHVFKRGHTLRTQVGHMNASITRLGPDRLLVLVFRSMAGTLVTELRHALEAVHARG